MDKIKSSDTRIIYYDVMRIVAVFFVLFNHLDGYELYKVSSGWTQWVYLFLAMLTRINVPLFLMVSGALLLGREESWRTIFRKRILRFVLIISAFTVALILSAYKEDIFAGTYSYPLYDVFLDILAGGIETSYWYLYAYLGFLFMLPFLRRIARGLTRTDFWILFVLHFIFASLIPGANFVISLVGGARRINVSDYFDVFLATQTFFFFPLIGYYIDKNVPINKLRFKHLLTLAGATVMGIFLSSLCMICEGKTSGTYAENYIQMCSYLTAIFAFIMIKYLFTQRIHLHMTAGKIVNWMGAASFGIYLLDTFVKRLLHPLYAMLTESKLPALLTSFEWCCISMVVGGGITIIYKRPESVKSTDFVL